MRARFEITRDWRGAPVPAAERVAVDVALDDDVLTVLVDAPWHGDAPPATAPGSTDRLWEHEVVELFLVGKGERYLEIELGPHGHYLALRLAGVRHVIERHLPVRYAARVDGVRWRGRATLARALEPEPVIAANAYAIHGTGSARRYLAAHPLPGAVPDFHRLASFPPIAWTRDVRGTRGVTSPRATWPARAAVARHR